MQEGSLFLHSLSRVIVYRLCDDDHSSGCEVIPHGGFDLHVPDDEWCWASFHDHKLSWLFIPLGSTRNPRLLSQHVVVQSPSRVQLFVTPWIAACQVSLSSIISQSLFKLMSIESVMLSKHLILCRPFLLLPSIFPRIRIFSTESALCITWPK